jgi:hypothetical protein
MFEKVYLHVGMHKTGSSYIQYCLGVLSAKNLLVDVDYPLVSGVADDRSSQTGNGQPIANFLLRSKVCSESSVRLKALVDKLFECSDSGKSAVIISSEEFWLLDAEKFSALKNELLRYAKKIVPIIFVRPLEDVCKSAYQQIIKDTGGYFEYDTDFVHSYSVKIIAGMKALDKYFDGEVVKYDKARAFEDFLSVVGEDSVLSGSFQGVRVNRSLSDLELELLRLINSVFKSRDISLAVCKAWLSSKPDMDVESCIETIYSRETFLGLIELSGISNGCVLKAVDILVGPVLADNVLPGGSVIAKEPVVSVSDLICLLAVALVEVKNTNVGLEVFSSYLKLHNILPITDSFDPLMYLLINKDLLLAGVNPYEHYKKLGKKEGRFTSYNTNSLLLS